MDFKHGEACNFFEKYIEFEFFQKISNVTKTHQELAQWRNFECPLCVCIWYKYLHSFDPFCNYSMFRCKNIKDMVQFSVYDVILSSNI